MATPSEVRSGLTNVTGAAVTDTRAVAAAAAGSSPTEIRAALFAAVPLIVGDYMDGSAALALDWYEEIRDAASPRRAFTPRPFAVVPEQELAASIAQATEALRVLEQERDAIADELIAEATRQSLAVLEPIVQKDVAAGFQGTVVNNANQDPDAVGWKRFARPEACKFCLMLAGRGAVYTRETARFAAHGAVMNGNRKGGNCMCIAGPEFGGKDVWDEATPIQYLASSKRSKDEAVQAARNARIREYLNHNYPDAPG